MPRASLKPHQTALLSAVLVAFVASAVPFVQVLLTPLVYLNTHIHELCHAISALLTGGQVQQILVNSNGSGLTPIAGGNVYISASAGYVGASLVGGCIIRFGSNVSRARIVLGILAVALSLSMIFFVRGDLIGVISGFAWIFLLGLGAAALRGPAALFVCQFIGLEQCLNSLTSVYQLFKLTVSGEAQSDAGIMQTYTMIPAIVWASGWCLFSLGVIFFTARWVWKSGSVTSRPTG